MAVLGSHAIFRRVIFWVISGQLVGLCFGFYLIIRYLLAQAITTPPHQMMGLGSLAHYALQAVVLGVLWVLVSPTIGYAMHQLYFVFYWASKGSLLRRQLTKVFRTSLGPRDRAYPVLKALVDQYGGDYTRVFGASEFQKTDGGAGRPQAQHDMAGRMESARHNWDLLRRVWMDAITRSHIEYVDATVAFKEDMFSLQGASMISLAVGYVLYVAYDLLVHAPAIAAGKLEYVFAVAVNAVLFWLGLRILQRLRRDTGEDALNTRRFFLHFAYETAGSPMPTNGAENNRDGALLAR